MAANIGNQSTLKAGSSTHASWVTGMTLRNRYSA